MHSKTTRFISILLCLCLVLGLAGCGTGKTVAEPNEEPRQPGQSQSQGQELSGGETQTRYRVDPIRLPEELAVRSRKAALYDGTLYVIGDNDGLCLYAKDLPDGDWRSLALTSPDEGGDEAADEEAPAFVDISGLAASAGGVFVLTTTYTEEGAQTSLIVCDPAGNTAPSSYALEEEANSCVGVGDGVALINRYGASYLYSAQGEPLAPIACEDEVLNTALADGELLFFTRPWTDPMSATSDDSSAALSRVDPQTGEVSQLCVIPKFSPYSSISYTSESGLFLADSDGLSALDAQTGESTWIMNWLDSGLNMFWGLNSLCVDKDGKIYVLASGELYMLTAYEGAARQELSIVAGAGAGGIYIDEAISYFNMSSETHVARLKNVSPEEMDKLLVEIAAGKGPDILFLGSSVDQENRFNRIRVKASLCEDLIPWLEADPDFSTDSFLPGVLEGRMTDGHLYSLDPGVQLRTITAPASMAGEDWTVDKLMEMKNGLPEGARLFNVWSRDNLLREICQFASVEYVDWSSASCSFDDASFARWLELCAGCTDDALQSAESDVLLMGSVWSGQPGYARETFGADYAYIGFPGREGTGQVLDGLGGFILLASSPNKEAGWAFLRKLLSPEVQTGSVTAFMCPVIRDSFEQWVKGNMASEWNDFTQEDGERIKAAIAGSKGTISGSTVSDIIVEEAQKYFDGQRSLEDTVAAIQSRAKVYVAEQAG